VLTFRTSLALAAFMAMAVTPVFGTTAPPATSSKPARHTAHSHGTQSHTTQTHTAQTGATAHGTQAAHGTRKGKPKARKPRGQAAMDTSRVTEIQQALIRAHYLSGEADGKWDERTKSAMLKYQADQGWQTKLTPDARALKKLGLGPDYSNAINAKNSTFAEPPPASTIPPAISDGFTEASGVKK